MDINKWSGHRDSYREAQRKPAKCTNEEGDSIEEGASSIGRPDTAGVPARLEPAKILKFYKTKTCPWFRHGRCRMGENCNWVHYASEIRSTVDLTRTKLCVSQVREGAEMVCKNANCRYAHSREELRATADVFKSAMCVFAVRGQCSVGPFCRYAHDFSELRRSLIIVPINAIQSYIDTTPPMMHTSNEKTLDELLQANLRMSACSVVKKDSLVSISARGINLSSPNPQAPETTFLDVYNNSSIHMPPFTSSLKKSTSAKTDRSIPEDETESAKERRHTEFQELIETMKRQLLGNLKSQATREPTALELFDQQVAATMLVCM